MILGFRHFNSTVDPDGLGSEEDCGYDKIDFLEGQVGNRSYEEGQRAPGDWEAIVSQRKIAVHSLEHPGSSDIGVYLCRRLLRDIVKGKTAPDPLFEELVGKGRTLPLYSQDSVLNIPELPQAEDRKQILAVGKKVMDILRSADTLADAAARDAHIRHQLDLLDGTVVVAQEEGAVA